RRASAPRLSPPPARGAHRLPQTLPSPTGRRHAAAGHDGRKEDCMNDTRSRRLGALLFPGFELVDLFGPLEMFGNMPGLVEIVTVAEHAGPVRSGQGPSAVA